LQKINWLGFLILLVQYIQDQSVEKTDRKKTVYKGKYKVSPPDGLNLYNLFLFLLSASALFLISEFFEQPYKG